MEQTLIEDLIIESIRDEMVLTVAQRRFHEEVSADNTTKVDDTPGINRPAEGDLIFFPLNQKIFEVKFVEHETVFYQMGELQTYDLTVELFEYSHERIDTTMERINSIETQYSGDMQFTQILAEDGTVLLHEDGSAFVNESYRIEDTDAGANNEFFETQTRDPSLNFIDWSESNPFGDF
jgi:hypothetical protein